jgi:hypothetical protein
MTGEDTWDTREISPKPNGVLLVLIAGCIAIGLPFVTTYLSLREFDVDSRVPRYQAMLSLPLFVFLVLPIIFLILFVLSRRCIGPFLRSFLVLSPVLVLTVPALIEAAISPVRASVEFAERMEHSIPDDARGFKAWFSHSPGETNYMFTFSCSAQSTEAILASGTYRLVENSSMLDPGIRQFSGLPIGGSVIPKAWPRPNTWDGLKLYQSEVPGGYRYLLTDVERSRVFILVGDT